MENITEMSYDNDSSKSIAKERNSRYRSNGRLEFAEERLFSMKAQDIADDLTQIMMFIKELERFWFENSETLSQIHTILSKLRSGDRNYKYTRVVHVLTKYLSGIRDFATTTNARGVIFYKKLFESTLVAIIQELDSLEQAY